MYENLMELRTLRAQEEAIEARIKEIAGAAAQEAVEILAAYHKYKDDLCVQWRQYARIKADLQNHVKSYTQKMASNIKSWAQVHPDKEPDKVLLTVKVVDENVEG